MNPKNRPILIFFVVWFAIAIFAGATDHIAGLRPPYPQYVLLGLTGILLILERVVGFLKRWVNEVDIRALVALHLVRIAAGTTFVVLGKRGVLPLAFTEPSGWGDIGVGLIAGLLILSGGVTTARDRRLYLFWNSLGLLDLIFVVVTAGRLAMADPHAMHPLLHLPLSILPSFLVPILLASHIWIMRRVMAAKSAE